MDKRLITVIVMAVVVALVITAIFYQITVGRRPTQTAVAKKELVVAKEDLAMGSEIQGESNLAASCTPTAGKAMRDWRTKDTAMMS